MEIPQEAIVAITGLLGSSGVLGYAAKKWADTKVARQVHEMELEKRRQEHELLMETKKEERSDKQAERDRQTAGYIQSNTSAIEALTDTLREQTTAIKEMREAFQREVGNGIAATVRNNSEKLDELIIAISRIGGDRTG